MKTKRLPAARHHRAGRKGQLSTALAAAPDPLLEFYDPALVAAYRRREPNSGVRLLRSIEKPPLAHVRTRSEFSADSFTVDDILPRIPGEIEYEHENGARYIIYPGRLSAVEFEAVLLALGRFIRYPPKDKEVGVVVALSPRAPSAALPPGTRG